MKASPCKHLSLRTAAVLAMFALSLTTSSFAADPAPLSWKQLDPARAFPERASFATAYDPVSKMVIVFGGVDGTGELSNETWGFDGNVWINLMTRVAPSARFGATMAYDRKTHRLVLFGGSAGFGRLSDTWLFDGSTLRWKNARVKNIPPGASNAMMFTDPANGHADLFGGRRTQFYSRDTYQWTGSDWILLNPVNSPYPRAGGIAVVDPVHNNVVVFGGLSDNWITQNTWTWDGQDWTQQTPSAQPDTLYFTAGAYDRKLQQVIVFGGGSGGVDQTATWSWDGGNWNQLAPVNSPPGREQFGTVWDSATSQFLIFGGTDFGSGQIFGDTWKLSGQ
ncbi:MAG: hypothetical protein HY010_19255 [Acidobacteria bacterium]|nr:hypothetical protein [Acidobacteriota bacterium]